MAITMPQTLPQESATIEMCPLDPIQTSSLSLGIMTRMTPSVAKSTQLLWGVIMASIPKEEAGSAVESTTYCVVSISVSGSSTFANIDLMQEILDEESRKQEGKKQKLENVYG